MICTNEKKMIPLPKKVWKERISKTFKTIVLICLSNEMICWI